MKKPDSKKVNAPKGFLHNPLVKPIQKLFKVIGHEIRPTSSLELPVENESDTLLTYDRLQRMNLRLLKLEMLRAQAIRIMRERTRFL